MANKYYKCKYCGAITTRKQCLCSNCYTKLMLIRKLQKIIRQKAGIKKQEEHHVN